MCIRDRTLDVEEDTPSLRLYPKQDHAYTLIIDPIDGTLPYIQQADKMCIRDRKSTYPTVDKVIVDGNTNIAKDANIGDMVTFKLTSVVPDMTGYSSYTFNFKDTLSEGLTFGEISSVKIGEKILTEDNTDTPKEDTYTLTKNGQSITITFNNFISNKDSVGVSIEVTYTAILNEKAVSGMNPNSNSATVEYSNDPSNPATGTEDSEPSVVDTYF